MTMVNVGQAKTELSRLIARAEAGEDVEIARNGSLVTHVDRVGPVVDAVLARLS